MISKMHKEMNVAIDTAAKLTKQKDKAGMQWDVSCIMYIPGLKWGHSHGDPAI